MYYIILGYILYIYIYFLKLIYLFIYFKSQSFGKQMSVLPAATDSIYKRSRCFLLLKHVYGS